MTTASGRCHGPGCTREARIEFFCSETCQDRWNSGLELPSPTVDRETAAKRALGHLLDWQRADLSLRAVCPPARLEDAKAAAFERHAYLGLAEAFRSVADDLAVGWLPPSSGAASPQVASENPQVASNPDPARRRCYCGQIPDGGGGHSPGIPGCIPELTCGCSNSSRGWLSRTLDRLFGRTT